MAEQVTVKVLKSFISPIHGSVEKGQELACDPNRAKFWAEHGIVETKQAKKKKAAKK